MKHWPLFAALVMFLAPIALGACLRGIEVKPAPPSPFVEVCASYYGTQVCADFAKAQDAARVMAKASATPSGTPRAVATVEPSAKPAGGL